MSGAGHYPRSAEDHAQQEAAETGQFRLGPGTSPLIYSPEGCCGYGFGHEAFQQPALERLVRQANVAPALADALEVCLDQLDRCGVPDVAMPSRLTWKHRLAQSSIEAAATVLMAVVLWRLRPDLSRPWIAFLVTLAVWTGGRICDGFARGFVKGMAP